MREVWVSSGRGAELVWLLLRGALFGKSVRSEKRLQTFFLERLFIQTHMSFFSPQEEA